MTTLGKYELHEEIGQGGFGTVYRAVDIALDREVALRVLPPQLINDLELLEKIRGEIKSVAKLDSPFINPIYEMKEMDGRIIIATRYLSGGSLKSRLEEKGAFSFKETLKVMEQICEGLQEAHKKGLVHGGINSSNILFDNNGNTVINNFGLIQKVSVPVSEITDELDVSNCSTVEQYLEELPVNPIFDVHSLGCLLAEMLTGVVFINSDGPIVKQNTIESTLMENCVSAPILKVIRKALTSNPQDRFQSVHEFLLALQDCSQNKLGKDNEVKKPIGNGNSIPSHKKTSLPNHQRVANKKLPQSRAAQKATTGLYLSLLGSFILLPTGIVYTIETAEGISLLQTAAFTFIMSLSFIRAEKDFGFYLARVFCIIMIMSFLRHGCINLFSPEYSSYIWPKMYVFSLVVAFCGILIQLIDRNQGNRHKRVSK